MTPTHEERLMRYLDREVDAKELREIEEWLAGSSEARALLSSLERVRDAVRAIGDDAGAGGDGIADAVMAALLAEAPDPAGIRTPGASAGGPAKDVVPFSHRRAVGRRWMGFAPALGLGLAAAAAVVVYFRPVPSEPVPSPRSSVPSATLTEPSPVAEVAEQAPVAALSEPGAEIESVDFGAQAGTIFMVPGSDSDEAETPVVWLMDEAAPTEVRMAPL